MSVTTAAAGLLAVSAAIVGSYAELAPRSFYERFPISGHPWIAPIGAYNEHLIRDVGSAYLALLVLSLWALPRPTRQTTRLVGSVWMTYALPHLAFHLAHLDEFGTADQVGNLVALGGTAALSLVLVAARPRSRRQSGSEDPAHGTWQPAEQDGSTSSLIGAQGGNRRDASRSLIAIAGAL